MPNLPSLPDETPECNRTDGSCPAYRLHWQASNETGLGNLGKIIADRLKKDTKKDDKTVENIEKEANTLNVTGTFLEREIGKLKRSGELCSICPYRERR